jgi:lysozyme
MVYTNSVWWSDIIRDPKKIAVLADYPIWIADYSASGLATETAVTPDNRSWTFWQFTDVGQAPVGAIPSLSVDADVFGGTYEQFKTAMSLVPARH